MSIFSLIILKTRLTKYVVFATTLLCTPAVAGPGGGEPDVTFSTAYASGRPTTANFYYNGRAVGAGRDAFAEVIERIGKLPAGASVVWGPNYRRCGACGGGEPGCVPKFLYPDLWQTLEAHVKERRLTLSSAFPGPWSTPAEPTGQEPMPAALPEDDAQVKQPFDAVLNWDVAEEGTGRSRDAFSNRYGYQLRLSSAGKTLDGYGLDLFFGRLPENARVLIRVSFHGQPDALKRRAGTDTPADAVRAFWHDRIDQNLRIGRLKAVLAASPELVDALQPAPGRKRLDLSWNNYHGPRTPNGDVLYLLNGQFVGRGDEGFSRVLAEIDKLKPGADVVLPRYRLGGRAAIENTPRKN